MRKPDRKAKRLSSRRGTFLPAFSLLLVGAVLLSSTASLADVGDQYLPQIPDAGGKKDKYGTGAQTAAAPATTTTSTTTTKKTNDSNKKTSDGSDENIQVATPPPDQGGGPGTGAVIALSLLGIALVGAVLWLVARGQRSLAEAEQPDPLLDQPDTPRGEITGDGPARSQQ